MSEDNFITRAFNRLVLLLAASPLAALVLGAEGFEPPTSSSQSLKPNRKNPNETA
jgi:hypothetical protein